MLLAAVLFTVYGAVVLGLIAYKRAEVAADPEAMPVVGHLRGWYAAAAVWPAILIFVALLVLVTLIVELVER